MELETIPSVFIMPEIIRPLRRPPELLREACAKSDVVIALTGTNVEEQIFRMNLLQSAKRSNTRVAHFPDVNVDDFRSEMFDVNYAQVADRTQKLYNILTNVDKIAVSSENGTKISFGLTGTKEMNSGLLHEAGQAAIMPGGEVRVEPNLETVSGTIVVDGAMTLLGKIKTPVKIKVAKGEIKSISDKIVSGKFKEYAEEEPSIAKISAFGIGTNHGTKVYENVSLSRNALGACSFSSGSSHTFGGAVVCKYKLNMILKSPTVKFDGRDVIKDGKYVVNLV
ncbi:MAG: hypothetical protein JXA43_01345 [Candidatus Diapherotrites archaeon]|nr:hypothetical protein [Candidatus Diapherotrites archaeon]